ncbi:MAG: hypothetical protein HC886_01185 [Leptolyngbyaceae cyanobacterium SM1_1_3]|nr:hypothetical protein [Leptolyngbyaceae cyanobacterium SM1_1_3]NJN03864.1 hypothetical protein [Leptolyngbyaceae cyanobacterium RM1_1_2]NJO10008.1 hypothetical protein [Leptolyngbyaceae cyanobacterium SL_1_1]
MNLAWLSLSAFLGIFLTCSGTIQCAQAASILLNTDSGDIGAADPFSGSFTPTFSGPAFSDIALSQAGNTVGVSADGQLYQIKGSTATAIGSLGLSASVAVTGLGFDTQSRLYALGLDSQSQTGQVYQVDTRTGLAAPFVGGLPAGIYGDIVFDADRNHFFGVREAAGISPASTLFSLSMAGLSKDIGSVGFSAVTGLAISNGALYGYTRSGEQLLINRSTGAGTFDLALSSLTGSDRQFSGAASAPIPLLSVPRSPSPVPEPSFLLAALAGGGLGALMRRYRRRSEPD